MLINLTSSEQCVRLCWSMFMQKAKSWNCVIAPSHNYILLVLNKAAFRFLKQDGLPVSHLLPPFPLTSNRLPFLFSLYLFSVWAALHGHCSVCPLPGLSSLVELSTGCHTADSNMHPMQMHEDIHNTKVASSSATHIVLAYVVTYMSLPCSKICSIQTNLIIIESACWCQCVHSESPVRVSCLFLFSLGVCRT